MGRRQLQMGRVDPRIEARFAGQAFAGIREQFAQVNQLLLSVHPAASSEFTTIYGKYKIDESPMSPVFGVMWCKCAQKVWLGLALPSKARDPAAFAAPPRMNYKGLTTYVKLSPDTETPSQLSSWIREAYEHVRSRRYEDAA
jgi:hypothetical protein